MNAAPLVESPTDSQARFDRALTMLHTHRGNPLAEVDRLLADDPGFVAWTLSARRAARTKQ